MSFKVTTSAVSICNMALGLISESKTINSIDDPGFNAQVCRRWYQPIVARLLETHHWGIATTRYSMPQVTNLRSNEWLYAFAPPDDLAFPVGMSLQSGITATPVSYYRGLNGLLGLIYGKPAFLYQSHVIYSNMLGDLEYVSFNITETDFTATFTDIVVTMLAARLAAEIPKNNELAKALEDKAGHKLNMAIVENLNSGQHKYGLEVSEGEMARGSLFGRSWDYFPRTFGS